MTTPARPPRLVDPNEAALRLSARLTAASVVLLGICAVLNTRTAALRIDGVDPDAALAWAVAGLPLAAMFVIVPWRRLGPTAFLTAMAALFVFVLAQGWATGYYDSAFGPAVQAAEFLILSTLVGLTQRRGVPTLFALYMLVVFALSSAITGGVRVMTIGAILGTVLCIAQGEVVAWSVNAHVDTRRRELRRLEDLEQLSRGIARLRRGVASADALATVIDLTAALLRADGVRFLAAGGDVAARSDHPFEVTPELARSAEAALAAGQPRQDELAGRWLLLLPLAVDDRPIGTLLARSTGHDRFDSLDVELGVLLAAEAAGALDQLRAIESLSSESTLDALTGVGNRRHADRLLDTMRDGDGLIIIDLDDFKQVNDAHGHAAGDRVLREVGRFLRSATRDDSLVARYGGDEFILVVPGAGAEAEGIAERLRRSWSEGDPTTTFSTGTAHHDRGSAAATFERADQSLYAAKRGRISQQPDRAG